MVGFPQETSTRVATHPRVLLPLPVGGEGRAGTRRYETRRLPGATLVVVEEVEGVVPVLLRRPSTGRRTL